jgi:hypothetical protein
VGVQPARQFLAEERLWRFRHRIFRANATSIWEELMASAVDPLRNSWQHLFQQTCAETDSGKLPELVSRLEDALLLRQTELATSTDHSDERVAIRLASTAVLRIKTTELGM